MIQTTKTDVIDNLFPFSSIETLSITIKEEIYPEFKQKKKSTDAMELPVNNYLKSPQEIEREFQYGINPRKVSAYERKSGLGLSTTNTDGYLNIHNLDEALSGFMEENY